MTATLEKGTGRTHYCGQLREGDAGRRVVLAGWVQRRRDHGGLTFIDLRDREGIVQVVFNPGVSAAAHELAHDLRAEFVIRCEGVVAARPAEMVNPKLATGRVEVMADKLDILNASKTPPFEIEDDAAPGEQVRLRYRYLDLRRPAMTRQLVFRHQAAHIVRGYLNGHGFLDIETPFLTRSTPEGARDYLVPSRLNPGRFYALPQSPQLFKQLLMVAGFDRYYQIVRCFRDEDLRADRQPEFTQIDLEMSFVAEEDVMGLMEGMMAELCGKLLGFTPPLPMARLTYGEAMARFGTDRPDLRFALELRDVSDLVQGTEFKAFAQVVKGGGIAKAVRLPGADFSRKELDELVAAAVELGAKGLAWVKVKPEGPAGQGPAGNGWQSPIAKFFTDDQRKAIDARLEAVPGDLLIFVADAPKVTNAVLAELRLRLGKRLGLIDDSRFEFVWIHDFPLLEYDDEEKRWVAVHHPFTAPKEEDLALLESEPGRVRARSYDLVLNGTEIGGGSVRIHRTELQERVFRALSISEEDARAKFGFLLEALDYGAPPHAGVAFGFDRLVALLAGLSSIREVIAFPKTQKAVCLLTSAPEEVEPKQLRELSIRLA